jgi:diguanylate cyclase
VFSNLLNNASRRSPPGGDILLAMALGADQVVVTVADRGVGIAPEALPHIFDLFTLDTNLPVDESGLGIGLAVVNELVKAHGGTVAASSAGKDLGSEFIVRLPLAATAS